MKPSRPTAADRRIAEFVRNLPVGDHRIVVQPDHRAPLKAEGSLIVARQGGTRIVIIPERSPTIIPRALPCTAMNSLICRPKEIIVADLLTGQQKVMPLDQWEAYRTLLAACASVEEANQIDPLADHRVSTRRRG